MSIRSVSSILELAFNLNDTFVRIQVCSLKIMRANLLKLMTLHYNILKYWFDSFPFIGQSSKRTETQNGFVFRAGVDNSL